MQMTFLLIHFLQLDGYVNHSTMLSTFVDIGANIYLFILSCLLCEAYPSLIDR